MLVEQLIRETLELQGFRIESVKKKDSELLVTIEPDLGYHPRCGICGLTGDYRDTLPKRYFRHVPIWGIDVNIAYSPCRVSCTQWRMGVRSQLQTYPSLCIVLRPDNHIKGTS